MSRVFKIFQSFNQCNADEKTIGLLSSEIVKYLSRRVLGITAGIQHPGGIQWELLGTLILAWLTVYLIIMKGLHASGKIVWFTALFPYFVIITLLFKAITLEGAGAGTCRAKCEPKLKCSYSLNSSSLSFKFEWESLLDSFLKLNF